jgi:hypothetical protein
MDALGVVDLGSESDLRRLERVVGRESDGEEEDTARVRRVTGAHDRRLPLEHVVSSGTGRAGRGRVASEVEEFLCEETTKSENSAKKANKDGTNC